MYAVEFKTNIDNGIIKIPSKYNELKNANNVRLIIMCDNVGKNEMNEINIFSNHSANIIEEWKDDKEDEIWI